MSAQTQTRRITAPEIRARKGGEPIVCLTAYDAPMARLLDPHCDLLLVGDSVGTRARTLGWIPWRLMQKAVTVLLFLFAPGANDRPVTGSRMNRKNAVILDPAQNPEEIYVLDHPTVLRSAHT